MLARAVEGPLDDPDPAQQRPGFVDLGPLPQPAPTVGAVPAPGRRAVVFFERRHRIAGLCQALRRRQLSRHVDVVIVAPVPAGPCPGIPVVPDPGGRLAGGYGLRTPRGGGPPVGYAVVDSSGSVRYRTLDPSVADELEEVGTIVDAVP